MRAMHWSWEQLQATPVYVRRYCQDFTSIQNRIAAARAERQQAKLNHQG